MATVTSLPGLLHWSIVAGDDVALELTFLDDAGAPVDLTGRTYSALVLDDAGTTVATITTSTPDTTGVLVLSLSDTTTGLLTPGMTYRWKLVEQWGTTTSTLLDGGLLALSGGTAGAGSSWQAATVTLTTSEATVIVSSGGGGGGGGAATLDELADVAITAPASGDLLLYGGAEWSNEPGGDLYDPAGAADAALGAALAASQPVDADLTAIAALTTTTYGRAFLALLDAVAGRSHLELGTAATSPATAFQPSDSDLTAIAALSTTTFGRNLLTLADAAALRAAAAYALDDLADVNAPAPAEGNVLTRTGSQWVPAAPTGGGGGGTSWVMGRIRDYAAANVQYIGPRQWATTGDQWFTYPSGHLICSYFTVPFTGTLNQAITEVQAGVAFNFRFGLWSDANGQPGTLLFDSGSISAATAGQKIVTITPDLAVTAGTMLWTGYVTDGAVSLLTLNLNNVHNFAFTQYAWKKWIGRTGHGFVALSSNPVINSSDANHAAPSPRFRLVPT